MSNCYLTFQGCDCLLASPNSWGPMNSRLSQLEDEGILMLMPSRTWGLGSLRIKLWLMPSRQRHTNDDQRGRKPTGHVSPDEFARDCVYACPVSAVFHRPKTYPSGNKTQAWPACHLHKMSSRTAIVVAFSPCVLEENPTSAECVEMDLWTLF